MALSASDIARISCEATVRGRHITVSTLAAVRAALPERVLVPVSSSGGRKFPVLPTPKHDTRAHHAEQTGDDEHRDTNCTDGRAYCSLPERTSDALTGVGVVVVVVV